jgi:hypothetical protein
MTELNYLHLANNQLTGTIPNISSLTKLTFVAFTDNNLSGTIPDLSALTVVKKVFFKNNADLTGDVSNISETATTCLVSGARLCASENKNICANGLPRCTSDCEILQAWSPDVQCCEKNQVICIAEIGDGTFLSDHNAFRSNAGVTNDLVTDAGLVSEAADYAEVLVSQNSGKLKHSTTTNSGENLYASSQSGTAINHEPNSVRLWCEEGVNIGYNHHTQVAWKTTTKVGCAQASGICGTDVVCRYEVFGNLQGKKYYDD